MWTLLDRFLEFVFALDSQTVRLVLDLRGPLVTKVMTSVTGLGSLTAALVFLGLFYLAGWRRELLLSGVSLAFAGAAVGALMGIVRRSFPPSPVCVTGGAETVAHSFPSGHAAAVVVFALTAARSDELPTLPVAGLALVVAASRVYLGTHYLSDTIAGMAVGAGAVLLGGATLQRLEATDAVDRVLPDAG